MAKLIAIVCVIVGLIHIIPITGVLGAEKLSSLYGVSVSTNANIEILLRHRAILLGLIGVLLLYSAFSPSVQLITILIALTSTLSFIAVNWLVGNANTSIQQVAFIDWIASGLLIIALAAALIKPVVE